MSSKELHKLYSISFFFKKKEKRETSFSLIQIYEAK